MLLPFSLLLSVYWRFFERGQKRDIFGVFEFLKINKCSHDSTILAGQSLNVFVHRKNIFVPIQPLLKMVWRTIWGHILGVTHVLQCPPPPIVLDFQSIAFAASLISWKSYPVWGTAFVAESWPCPPPVLLCPPVLQCPLAVATFTGPTLEKYAPLKGCPNLGHLI